MNGNFHFENCQVKIKAEVKEFFSSTLNSTSTSLKNYFPSCLFILFMLNLLDLMVGAVTKRKNREMSDPLKMKIMLKI